MSRKPTRADDPGWYLVRAAPTAPLHQVEGDAGAPPDGALWFCREGDRAWTPIAELGKDAGTKPPMRKPA